MSLFQALFILKKHPRRAAGGSLAPTMGEPSFVVSPLPFMTGRGDFLLYLLTNPEEGNGSGGN